MKKTIFILTILLTLTGLTALDLKLEKKISLIETETIIQGASSIQVTDDNIIFLSDLREGNIKAYDFDGKLLSTYGGKGAGPKEFIFPAVCTYGDGLLAVMDLGKRKIFIYNRDGKTGLKEKMSLLCTGGGDDIAINGAELLISGQKNNKEGKAFDLYSQNTSTGEIKYLLPIETKYGCQSYQQYRTKNENTQFYSTLSRVGYCDRQGNHAYYVWQGDLKVFKINMASGDISVFGHPTKNYVKPYVTERMKKSRLARERRVKNDDREKMSFVIGLFAGDGVIGVMYRKIKMAGTSTQGVMIQFYSPEGQFIKEVEMGDRPSNLIFFRKKDNSLFCMNSIDHDRDDPVNYVLHYKLVK